MSTIELNTYTTGLSSHRLGLKRVIDRSSSYKDGHVTVYLVDPGLGNDTGSWKYDKSVRLIML